MVSDITSARKSEYLFAALNIVRDAGEDGIAPRELFPKVKDLLNPIGVEMLPYKGAPSAPRFQTITRFMTIRAVKAGWLVKSNARWYITSVGVDATKQFATPSALGSAAITAYNAWKASVAISDELGYEELGVPSEPLSDLVTTQLETARDTAADGIRLHLQNMNEYRFQSMVGALLAAMGYYVSWIAPPGPDGGIDIIAFPDPIGAQKPRIKVQVKHSGDAVSRPILQAFFGILGADDVGIFVSLGSFTREAAREARNHPAIRVTLLDAERFIDLWIQHYSKMTEEQKSFMRIEPVFFLAPE